MNGTVVRVRRRGVEATMDGNVRTLNRGDSFQVLHAGQVVATVAVWKILGDLVRLNYPDPTFAPPDPPQVGDTVSPVPAGP